MTEKFFQAAALLVALTTAMTAAAAELYYLRYQPSIDVTQDAVDLSNRLSAVLGEPLSLRLVRYNQVEGLLVEKPGPGFVAELSPMFFNDAVEAGWTPLLTGHQDLQIALYQLADTDALIDVVGTPPRLSLGAVVARSVFGADYRYVEYADHANCLRTLLVVHNAGCMAPTFVADGYAQHIGVELRQIAGPFAVPASVVFASPGTRAADLAGIADMADQSGARYRRFTPSDADPYRRLIRRLSRSQ